MGILQKLFGKSSAPASAAGAKPGVQANESTEDIYPEFCDTFCIRPGVKLMDFLKENNVTRLIAWLNPATPCALPKGFIRMSVDATRKGYNIWEHKDKGISMSYEGNWTKNGGLPDQESLDALSVLAQVLDIRMNLYYTETEGGPQMVMRFEPNPAATPS